MPISVDLPSRGGVRFLVSPLVELGWAWHLLAGPDHHPDRRDWVSGVEAALPDDLVEDLAAWSFAVRAVRSTYLADPTLVPGGDWDDRLARLARLPADDFAALTLRPLLRFRGRPADPADPATREATLALARARGAAAVTTVRSLLDRPEAARDAFLGLLARCWRAFFAAEWAALAPTLHAEARARALLCGRDGAAAALRGLSPAIEVRGAQLVIDKVQSKRVDAAAHGLVAVPTVLGAPHVYVTDEPDRPVVVHYPVPAPARAADRRLTLRRMQALAHPARLEICRAIAVEPRSAREIARLWRFSEDAVTKHLSVLRDAGLVRGRRVGHYVRYSLDGPVIELLGADLLEVLRR